MPRGRKKQTVDEPVMGQMEQAVVPEFVPPTETKQLQSKQTYLLELRKALQVEGFPVPSELDVKLGQVNQRLKELGV